MEQQYNAAVNESYGIIECRRKLLYIKYYAIMVIQSAYFSLSTVDAANTSTRWPWLNIKLVTVCTYENWFDKYIRYTIL